jgi:hypothetical protein
MNKAEIKTHWHSIDENQPVKPFAVPYRHTGSTYGLDGIRLNGSKEFIDSVLSNLKGLLNFENGETRLQLVYKQSTDRNTGLPLGDQSWNCYVQVHQRGNQSIMANHYL